MQVTGVIVTEFACHLGVELIPSEAQCLIKASNRDTGRFLVSKCLMVRLLRRKFVGGRGGASPPQIALTSTRVIAWSSISILLLVMGRIRALCEGRGRQLRHHSRSLRRCSFLPRWMV